jgi:hypothetical protein
MKLKFVLSFILITTICAFAPVAMQAQTGNTTPANDSLPVKGGDVQFHAEGRIDSLEKRLRGKTDLKGYRIQIFLGSYQDAKNVRAKFLTNSLGLQAYIAQNAPDYVVRVGDFKTSLELHKYLDEVKKSYPGSLVVVDKIEPPRFPKHK